MSYLERCRERCRNVEGDEGFTLIELLVVLLIIGILLAIAIPTFLSVTKGANGTAAQSNLNTALTGGDAYYTDGNQSFVGLTNNQDPAGTSSLGQIDTGLSYVSSNLAAGNSTGSHVISLNVGNAGQSLVMAAFAPGQNICWGIVDIKSTLTTAIATKTAVGTYYFGVTNSSTASCNAQTLTSAAMATTIQGNGWPSN